MTENLHCTARQCYIFRCFVIFISVYFFVTGTSVATCWGMFVMPYMRYDFEVDLNLSICKINLEILGSIWFGSA